MPFARRARSAFSLLGRLPALRGSSARLEVPAARHLLVPASSADALEPIEDLVVRTANSDLDPGLKGSLLRSLVKGERELAERGREHERAERERAEKEKVQLLLDDAVLQVTKLQGQLSMRGLFGELLTLGCRVVALLAGPHWRGVRHWLQSMLRARSCRKSPSRRPWRKLVCGARQAASSSGRWRSPRRISRRCWTALLPPPTAGRLWCPER